MPQRNEPLTAEELERATQEAELTMAMLTEAILPQSEVAKLNPITHQRIVGRMVDEIFKLCGRNPEEHQECWRACRDKTMSTNVLSAQTFSSWGGHKQLTVDLNILESLRNSQGGGLFMLPAPSIVAASIAKNIRKVRGNEKDFVSSVLKRNNLWSYMDIAIDAFPHFKKKAFKIEWTASAADAMSFSESPESPESLGVASVPPRLPNNVSTMIEIREAQTDVPRVLSLSPEPQVMEMEHTITRQQAMDAAGDLFNKLGQSLRFDQEALATEMKEWLSEPRIRVMPEEIKNRIYSWCMLFDPDWIEIIKSSAEDMTTCTYIERRPEPKIHLITDVMKKPIRQLQTLAQAITPDQQRKALLVIADQLITSNNISTAMMKESEQRVREGFASAKAAEQQYRETNQRLSLALKESHHLRRLYYTAVEEVKAARAHEANLAASLERSRGHYIEQAQLLQQLLNANQETMTAHQKRVRFTEDVGSRSSPRANEEQMQHLRDIVCVLPQQGTATDAFFSLLKDMTNETQCRELVDLHCKRFARPSPSSQSLDKTRPPPETAQPYTGPPTPSGFSPPADSF